MSNVTNMDHMFSSCKSLTTLDLSSWDTSNITNMYGMFSSCEKLETLDLSNFDISNVTGTGTDWMFYGCHSLHTLRLDNCSKDTISKIITSSSFSKGAIEGVTRKIYCKKENAAGLTAPTNWIFEYID
jgi:surface protein